MKKIIAIAVIALMIITLTGCESDGSINEPNNASEQSDANVEQQGNEGLDIADDQSTENLLSAEKIVIITDMRIHGEDEYLSAEALVNRFGQEQVIHKTWPDAIPNVEPIISDILRDVSENPEVGAVILSESVHATWNNSSVADALWNLRDDIFVVFIPSVLSLSVEHATGIDLIIQTDMQRLGELFVMQAISMGADTIAHYSSPLHRAVPAFALRREAMIVASQREGIRFVDLECPSEIGAMTLDILERFFAYITQDLPRQVESLGVNTAFFGTECIFQPQFISQTIATGAIFVSACCPSPFHGYPEGIEIEYRILTDQYDEFENPIIRRLELSELLRAMDEAVYVAGMAGRISSPAIPDRMMWITIGFMYAVQWMEGNVSQEHGAIDIEVLERSAREFTAHLGVDAGVTLEVFIRDGETVPHHILGVIDYHVFG